MFRQMADEFTIASLYGIKTFTKKVKEKVGMMKLIELLNEYETPKSGIVFKSYDDYDGTFYGVDCDGETEVAWSDSYICGKRYQWVKWLVENDRIDLVKFSDKLSNSNGTMEDRYRYLNSDFGLYHTLLMLLSISDTPIEDLILYLK